jgi:hypothetical protein
VEDLYLLFIQFAGKGTGYVKSRRIYYGNDRRSILFWKHNFLLFTVEDDPSNFVKCYPTVFEEKRKNHRR